MAEFADFLNELERIRVSDPIHGFDRASAHISAGGKKTVWIPSHESPTSLGLNKQRSCDLYYWMKLTRAVDEKIEILHRQSVAFGKHLLSTGNEATAVGAAYALKQKGNNWTCMAIRDLGAFLTGGMNPSAAIAQPCGRVLAPTKGWDASLHMSMPEKRLIGLVSHLGIMPCVATGLAFAELYYERDGIACAFIGDGATGTGDFHEALKIASRMQLPLIIIIENNQWAFGTPTNEHLALSSLAYGENVDGYIIDGTNVLTTYWTVTKAMRRARENRVISIIEARTMRMKGHSLADPYQKYVPAEQLAEWAKKDPIETYGKMLLEKNIASEAELRGIDEAVHEEIEEAVEEVLQSPEPDAVNIEQKVFSAPEPSSRVVLTHPPDSGKRISYFVAIREALWEIMESDPSVFLAGEDIGLMGGAFGVTEGFLKRFGKRRVIDTPIAEAGFCGLAAGAALQELRPIIEFQFADFASEAFPIVVHYVATHTVRGMGNMPVVFRMPAGCTTKNSGMFHSVNPESWFASTPGLKIVAPITAFDAKGLLWSAVYDNNPVLFLEYKEYYRRNPETLPPELNIPIPDSGYCVPIGKARILKEGKDLTLISYGSQIFRALKAAHTIEKEQNVSIEVIDLRTIVPCDWECLIESVQKTARAIVTCEAPQTGCFGQTIAHELQEKAFRFLDAPVRLVAAADTPVPFAKVLEEAHLPTAEKIVQTAREMIAI
jgi:2-oxoisovalerate dehydrogenase E1 component